MTTNLIQCDRNGSTWKVIICRPNKANALSLEMLHELKKLFVEATSDPQLRVLILTGAGSRVFCAGADLSELSNYTVGTSEKIWDEISTTLEKLPALTIAAINGACIGGGLSLALSCDIRIAVHGSVFSYPALRNNILPGEQDFSRLHALIGPGRSATLLLGSAKINADEAISWGLIDRVTDIASLANVSEQLSEIACNASKEHLNTIKQHCWNHP